jgi:hypothetical protein
MRPLRLLALCGGLALPPIALASVTSWVVLLGAPAIAVACALATAADVLGGRPRGVVGWSAWGTLTALLTAAASQAGPWAHGSPGWIGPGWGWRLPLLVLLACGGLNVGAGLVARPLAVARFRALSRRAAARRRAGLLAVADATSLPVGDAAGWRSPA